ncbi:MAG: hypothetical protein QM765_08605 [Myxococcales bacterium]
MAVAQVDPFNVQYFRVSADRLRNVVFCAGGDLLAVAGRDGFVRLMNPRSGAVVQEWAGDGSYVLGLASAKSAPRVVAGAEDGQVSVWNVETRERVSTFRASARSVERVDVDPGGTRVATGGSLAELWDANSGTRLALLAHDATAVVVKFSPDGKLLATGSDDHTVKLWRADDGALLKRLPLEGPAWDVAWAPDGQTLAATSSSGTSVWSLAGALVGRYPSATARLAIAPRGDLLAVQSSERALTLFPFQPLSSASPPPLGRVSGLASLGGRWVVVHDSGEAEPALAGDGSAPLQVSGSVAVGTGNRPLVATASGNLYRADLATRKLEKLALVSGTTEERQVEMSRDGSRLITWGASAPLVSWEVATGRSIGAWPLDKGLRGACALSGDGKMVAAGDLTGRVELLSVDAPQSSRTLKLAVVPEALAFDPSGGVLLARDTFTASVVDLTSGAPRWSAPRLPGSIWQAQWCGAGKLVCTRTATGRVDQWDPARPGQVPVRTLPGSDSAPILQVVAADGDLVVSRDITDLRVSRWNGREWKTSTTPSADEPSWRLVSPRGDWSATLNDGTLEFTDLLTGAVLSSKKSSKPLSDLAAAPDGSRLLGLGDDGFALFAPGTGEVARGLAGERLVAHSFSGDGRSFAVVDETGFISVFSSADGKARSMGFGSERVLALAATAAGDLVLTRAMDGSIVLWDASAAPRVVSSQASDGYATAAAISEDGTRVAWGSSRGIVAVLEVATGRRTDSPALGMAIRSVAFDGSGEHLVATSAKGARILDARDARTLQAYGASNAVTAAAISRRAELLALGLEDGTLRVIDVASGIRIWEGQDHKGAISAVAFSSDDRQLAVAGADGQVRSWATGLDEPLGKDVQALARRTLEAWPSK